MKFFKWQPGRQQNVTYKKCPLWYFKIGKWGFDAYILRYEAQTFLPEHKDPVENGKHWRLNVKLWGRCGFHADDRGYTKQWINFFRPDLYTHWLIAFTTTFKLSFGFVKFDKTTSHLPDAEILKVNHSSVLFANSKATVNDMIIHFKSGKSVKYDDEVSGTLKIDRQEAKKLIKLLQSHLKIRNSNNHLTWCKRNNWFK